MGACVPCELLERLAVILALPIRLLLLADPSMGSVGEFGEYKQVITREAR